jgi:hypothetical protein
MGFRIPEPLTPPFRVDVTFPSSQECVFFDSEDLESPLFVAETQKKFK